MTVRRAPKALPLPQSAPYKNSYRGVIIAAVVGVLFLTPFALFKISLPGDGWSAKGFPVVVDGDTLKMEGVRIRLHGIDAPESR